MTKSLIITSFSLGLLGGASFIVFSLILDSNYGSPLYPPAPKYNDFFIYLIVLAFAFFIYRRYLNRQMSFWQGLFLGIIVGGLTLIISLIFLNTFLTDIKPKVFENYKESLYQQMKTNNKEVIEKYGGKENYQKILKDLESITVSQYLWLETRQKLALTIFITLISSAFLRFRKVIVLKPDEIQKQ